MNMQTFKRGQFWAAVVLVIGFFLPWLSIGGGVAYIQGFQLADMMRQRSSQTMKDEQERVAREPREGAWGYRTPAEKAAGEKKAQEAQLEYGLSYLLYLAPVMGAICVGFELRHGRARGTQARYVIAGLITLALFAALYWLLNDDGKFLEQTTIGAWLSCAAAVVAIGGAFQSSSPPIAKGSAATPVAAVAQETLPSAKA